MKEIMSSAGNSNGSEGDSIKVYLRVRPPDQDNGVHVDSGQILTVQPPDTVILPCKPEPKVFTYDHVADIHTTQEAVFAAVGRKTIESCVAGYNATIFAYGQTGSGKTFTMMGPDEADNFHHELRGVIPRSFEYLFSLVNREREKQGEQFEFLCRVSFLEIYNEQIFDLLDSASTGLQLRENFKRGVFVDGLIEQVVSNPSDAFQVLSTGWVNRRVASTSMNRESSRSHAVFTFSIQTKEKKAGVSNIRVSQLHLVDLAGSERQKDTKTSGIRLKEAGSINKSLLTLGHVITALVDIGHGKTRHVPYRDSKLSFLLRDSLGGNAKTYIIANVHPGAKCFGETLSTLNFARRAKMIKNKAVVNEDTEGNTLHLQLEIKRLREQLLHFTQGNIPKEPNTSGMHTPTSLTTLNVGSAVHSNGEKKWRSFFLDAMYLREKTDMEKKNLLKKISRLEDLSNKKEQYLQSTKMIIRFRENTISRLQKNQAKEEPTEDQVVNDLRNEIAALKQQMAHNPTVTQYAMENRILRNENKKLMALQTVRSAVEHDNDRAQHLEKVFRELMANIEGGDRRTSVCPSPSRTPSQHGDQHLAVSSTIDRYKAQLKQMQAERDTARQELLEQAEVGRKTQLNLEAQVTSLKKTVNELENALEAFKVKTKIERDSMNTMHMRTIRTITTPRKVAHNLRNRVVTVPRNGNATPLSLLEGESLPEELSPLRDQDGIVDEEIPEHMIEQCNEALTEEVKKLQDENSRLLQSLQDNETHHLKLKQAHVLLEHQLEQKTQHLESEQQQKIEFKAEVDKLSAMLEDLQKDYSIAKSDAEVMKIMLQSSDKVTEEEKKQLHQTITQRERDIAALESKVLRMELELSTAQREMEKLTEEKRELQDVGNTLQEEVNFKEQRQEELESVVQEERKQRRTMAEEIQSLMEKLDIEFAKNAKLSAELREGSESKQQLVETLEIMERLQTDNSQLQNLCSEKDAQLMKAKDDLDAAAGSVAALQKRAAEDKDALASMVSTVQDLRQTILLKEDSLNMTTHELEDTRYHCESLQAGQEEYKNEVQGLQRELEEMTDEMNSLSCAHNMQMEMLQEDLDEVRGQYESLMAEMSEQEKHLQIMQAECEASCSQVDALRKQLSDKDEEIASLQEVYETKLEEAKSSNLSTVVVETECHPESQELKQTIDSQASEIASLRTRQQKFTELLEQFEIMRETKNEEIQQLKDSLTQLEHVQVEKEIFAAKCQTLQYQAEQWENEAKEKEMELMFSNRELRDEVSRLNCAFDSVTTLKDEAIEARLTAETELAQVKCNSELLEENAEQILEELERIKAMESGHFEEKENLKSCLSQLQEEKMQLLKEMKKTEEKNEELTAVNNKLAGHQNLKQKIHYHQQVKNENSQLKEQLLKMRNDSKLMRGELEQYKKAYGDLKLNGNGDGNERKHDNEDGKNHGNGSGDDTLPLETVKENVDPRMVMS